MLSLRRILRNRLGNYYHPFECIRKSRLRHIHDFLFWGWMNTFIYSSSPLGGSILAGMWKELAYMAVPISGKAATYSLLTLSQCPPHCVTLWLNKEEEWLVTTMMTWPDEAAQFCSNRCSGLPNAHWAQQEPRTVKGKAGTKTVFGHRALYDNSS